MPFFSCKIINLHFIRTASSINLIATKLFSSNRDGRFQQDGSCAYTSKATTTRTTLDIRSPPPPDLSQIVNIWNIMAAAVYANPEPQTLTALERRLGNLGDQFL